jgi:hypothetical protein
VRFENEFLTSDAVRRPARVAGPASTPQWREGPSDWVISARDVGDEEPRPADLKNSAAFLGSGPTAAKVSGRPPRPTGPFGIGRVTSVEEWAMGLETHSIPGAVYAVFADTDEQSVHQLKENLLANYPGACGEFDPFAWLTARAAYLGANPIMIKIFEGSELNGVVFLLERKIAGIAVGYYESPYLCGFGSYAGSEQHRGRNVVEAMSFLLRRRRTLKIRINVPAEPGGIAYLNKNAISQTNISVKITEKGSYFPIGEDVDSVLLRFSSKSRRNIRYFRRKAEERKQYSFLSDLDAGQRIDAVESLNAQSTHFMSHSKARSRSQAIQEVSGGFAAGLMAKDGTWLSYITGWRSGNVTYIDWQLNIEESNGFSFSAVMRADLIRHEIARGCTALYFLGGSNSTWESACTRHKVCTVEAKRNGLAVQAAKGLLHLLARLRPLNSFRKFANALHYQRPWGDRFTSVRALPLLSQ